MSLYSNEIRQFVRTRDWPVNLMWEVREFEDCLRILLVRENINSLDSDAKMQTATVLNTTLSEINKQGIPIYTWVATREEWDRIHQEEANARTSLDDR